MPPRRLLPVAVLAVLLVLVAGRAATGATPVRWIVLSAHPDGDPIAQLFRIQSNGAGLKQITTGRRTASAPSFSPNGRQIAFVRLGAGIFRMNADGTGLRRVTSGTRDSWPTWSPDGKQLAFVRPWRKEWRVHTVSVTGGKAHRLPLGPPAGRPTWTANGKGIYTVTAGDLVRIDARTGRAIKYYGLTLDNVLAQAFTLSPSALRIAYVGPRVSTGPEDCGEGPCPQFGLHLANVPPPHRARRILNDTGPAGWSPDGRTLAFVSRGALTLRPSTLKGKSTAVRLGDNIATGDAPPAWQPR
jgi:TolB protein